MSLQYEGGGAAAPVRLSVGTRRGFLAGAIAVTGLAKAGSVFAQAATYKTFTGCGPGTIHTLNTAFLNGGEIFGPIGAPSPLGLDASALRNEASATLTNRIPQVVSGLRAWVTQNGCTNGNCHWRLRIDAAYGNQEVILPHTGVAVNYVTVRASFSDGTHVDTIADGQRLCLSLKTDPSTDTKSVVCPAITMESDTSGFSAQQFSSVSASSYTVGAATYLNSVGTFALHPAENDAQQYAQVGFVASNLQINILSTTATTTKTFMFRRAGADGNQQIPMTAGMTGLREDGTHVDAVAANTLHCWKTIGGNGSPYWTAGGMKVTYANPGYSQLTTGGPSATGLGTIVSVWSFCGITQRSSAGGSAEYEEAIAAPLPGVVSNWTINTSANTMVADAPLTLRVRIANASSQVVIPANAGPAVHTDGTHVDAIAMGDTLNAVSDSRLTSLCKVVSQNLLFQAA
jgi:hypothetical protein